MYLAAFTHIADDSREMVIHRWVLTEELSYRRGCEGGLGGLFSATDKAIKPSPFLLSEAGKSSYLES